ncbi:hybrid sensor histidine kinase/response regulator [Xenophilus sp.]|uniref:hybrid sensor histidine kinase/response regulator n=1 Tax=Xenophilus sp. TaxID=1873499 RepID=UPI0037DD9757
MLADPPVTAPGALGPSAAVQPQPVAVPEEAVRGRLLRQLFVMGRRTQFAAFVAAVFTWVMFWALTRSPMVFAWAAAVHAAQALRWWHMRRNEQLYPADRFPNEQPRGAWRYVFPLATAAVAWGLAPWLMLPAGGPGAQPGAQALMAVMIFGMLAASLPGVAPWRSAVGAWLYPVGLGLASRFAWDGGVLGWALAAAAVMFTVVTARFGFTQHALLRQGLHAQLEKEALSEQLMRQSLDLERLHRERSRFFASASHDLRQPIHALALFSRSLQRDLQGHPSLPVADRVVEATDAVSGLLNAMLDISKIEAGAVQPVFAPVAIEQVFRRLAQIHGERAEAAGLALRFHPLPEVVATDADLVFRVLSNLVDNALKYTQRGGVLVSARVRGDRLRLAVWDTGRGVRAEHLPMLFDEFYQVDNAHRDISNGLGIGLSIVKRLAALLQAQVGLRSVHGRGSVFWLDLPRHAVVPPSAAPADVQAPASAAPGAVRPRVLVLDDERAVGEAMRIWLAPHCEQVDVAQTVAQACEALARAGGAVDVLIVDFRLADELNGIQAAALLREQAGRALPAILVTGDTAPARVRAAYESGLVVLFKPVQPEHLLERVRSLVGAPAA